MMKKYNLKQLYILLAGILLSACNETPQTCVCVCPQQSNQSFESYAQAPPNTQQAGDYNILASLIQISRDASAHRDTMAVAMNDDDADCLRQDDNEITEAIEADTQIEADAQPDTDTQLQMPENAEDFSLAQIAKASEESTAIGAAHGLRPPKAKKNLGGMPKNSRQVPEGYWIGSRPSVEQLKPLYDNDIRLIVTASRMNNEDMNKLHETIEDLGMKQLNIPFGGKFPKPERFMSVIKKYKPSEIYIHCDHGGDRSGAILAYLLVAEQGWAIPKALYAVIYPGPNDINGLNTVLKDHGFDISEKDYHDIMGIYSAENNGGFGGLKVRSANYQKLVNTLIDAMVKSKGAV